MKRYCLDTSGFSNPIQDVPEDIHVTLWDRLCDLVRAGHFATTQEVYDELTHIPGKVGECIKDHKAELVLEIGAGDWHWQDYIAHNNAIRPKWQPWIEGTGGSKASLSPADFSVIILAKTLALPVVSMEIPCGTLIGTKSRKIPDVCLSEQIVHMTFNDLLRAEGLRL